MKSIDCKALVTGGAGFIGSHLVDELAHKNAKVTVVDDLSYGKEQNLNQKASFMKCDILDYDSIKKAVEGQDLVFHLAACATTKESSMGWKDPVSDISVNVVGTLNILKAIVELKQKTKIIYASSAAVYGNPVYFPVDEQHATNPISPYGVSKLAGEKYCFAFSSEYGVNASIIRIFNTYGPRQPRYVMDDFYKRLRINPLILKIIGSGEQVRDFCFVKDTAGAFVKVSEVTGDKCEVYNVGTGKPTSIRELAEIMTSLIAPKADLVMADPTWKGDIKNLGPANIDKIKGLGFSPETGLVEGLKILINSYPD